MLSIRMHMEFEPEAYEEATSTLRSLVGPVRSEPGCFATHLHRGTGEDLSLTWVAEWRSVEHFERHLRASAFRRIIAVVEMAARPPKVEIDDVSSRRGFELVEEILGGLQAEPEGRDTN